MSNLPTGFKCTLPLALVAALLVPPPSFKAYQRHHGTSVQLAMDALVDHVQIPVRPLCPWMIGCCIIDIIVEFIVVASGQ
eukprot:89759-Ditylum_brightwellii.AAC.1